VATVQGILLRHRCEREWQSDNFTDELKDAGLRTPNSLKVVYDVNPGAGGPLVKDKLWFYSAARWQGTQSYIAGLYENKNAGDPTKWAYEPDLSRRAFQPLVQRSFNTRMTWQISPRNKVAVFGEHQYRVWEQLSPTLSYESATKYDFPENELFTEPILDDQQQVAVRRESLRHRPGLERPVSLRRRQPRVHQAASGCVQDPDCGDRAGWSHSDPALPRRRPDGPGTVHPRERLHRLRSGISLVHHRRHAFKVGFLDTFGTRREDYTNIPANVRYRFNNGVPNLITEIATPYGFRSNLGASSGCLRRQVDALAAHAHLGARFDYLNINFPNRALARRTRCRIGTSRFRRTTTWLEGCVSTLGAVYDVFGTGRTAVKFNLGRYVLAQRLTSNYTNLGNPVNAMANSVTRSWNDRGGLGIDGDYIPQCELVNPQGQRGVRHHQRLAVRPTDPQHCVRSRDAAWLEQAPDQWEVEASVQAPADAAGLAWRSATTAGRTQLHGDDNTLTGGVRLHAVQHSGAGRFAPSPAAAGIRWMGSTISTRTKWVRSTTSSPWPRTMGTTRSPGTVWTST
jgi:hypothetical protein